MSYMLIMQNEQAAMLAIGPVSIEYQAAMLRDDLEDNSGWTFVGIARILTETQAREVTGTPAASAPGKGSTQGIGVPGLTVPGTGISGLTAPGSGTPGK